MQPNKGTIISGADGPGCSVSACMVMLCKQTSCASSTCHTSCPGCMLLGRLQEALPLLGSAYPPEQSQQLSQSSIVTGLLLNQLLQLTQGICVLLLHTDQG